MPRVPSIKLRLARVLNTALERTEDELNKNRQKLLTKTEAETLLIMAKADAILRDRKPEDGEDEPPTGSAREADAAALIARLKGATAAQRAEGEDTDPEP
jgi:hypothetical protein